MPVVVPVKFPYASRDLWFDPCGLESGKVFRVNLADMTCSDACVKRSREQGCACRPDTVTRDILDRIESPEI